MTNKTKQEKDLSKDERQKMEKEKPFSFLLMANPSLTSENNEADEPILGYN